MKPINFSVAPHWRYFDSELSESWCKRKIKDICDPYGGRPPLYSIMAEELCDPEKIFLHLNGFLDSQGFQPRKAKFPYSSYEFAVITGSVSTHIDKGYGLVAGALLYATTSKKSDSDTIELVTTHGGLPLCVNDVFVFDANKWHGWISDVTCLLAMMTIKKIPSKKAKKHETN